MADLLDKKIANLFANQVAAVNERKPHQYGE
jgi:hypothetical protein